MKKAQFEVLNPVDFQFNPSRLSVLKEQFGITSIDTERLPDTRGVYGELQVLSIPDEFIIRRMNQLSALVTIDSSGGIVYARTSLLRDVLDFDVNPLSPYPAGVIAEPFSTNLPEGIELLRIPIDTYTTSFGLYKLLREKVVSKWNRIKESDYPDDKLYLFNSESSEDNPTIYATVEEDGQIVIRRIDDPNQIYFLPIEHDNSSLITLLYFTSNLNTEVQARMHMWPTLSIINILLKTFNVSPKSLFDSMNLQDK